MADLAHADIYEKHARNAGVGQATYRSYGIHRPPDPAGELSHALEEIGLEPGRVGVEAAFLPARIANALEARSLELVPIDEIVIASRRRKLPVEVDAIRRAAELGDIVQGAVREHATAGQSEEPVATLQELARLRSTTTMGFSTHCANLREGVALGVPDAFVVHFGMFGGIRRTANFVAACAEFRISVWFKSPDAGVATAAQLQLTGAIEALCEPSQTLLRRHGDEVIAEGCFVPKDGNVTIPDEPGLGVTLDPAALARCRDRYAQYGIQES